MTADDGERLPPDEAFSLLGNPLRISILQALWETQDPLSPGGIPFSKLYEASSATDSGQFNYHLKQLQDWYVDKTDDGYQLTAAGEQIVRGVLSGTLTRSPEWGPTDLPEECPFCAGTVEARYAHDRISFRCTECSGAVGEPMREGTYLSYTFPPAGLTDRGPEELLQAAHTFYDAKITPMMDGVCPECAGIVDGSLEACHDHAAVDDLCSSCNTRYQFWSQYRCRHCSYVRRCPAWFRAVVLPEVIGFYYTQGAALPSVPFKKLTAENAPYIESIQERLVETSPLRAAMDITWGSERITVTLDESMTVLDVSE